MTTGHPKHGTRLFGHFRPRFFIITGVIILLLVLFYIHISSPKWYIQLSYYNQSVIGDGVSHYVVPFTIFQSSGEPLVHPVQVQARSNIGTVLGVECSAPSVCNLTFVPPATSYLRFANITINAGGITKSFNITVNSDMAAYLSLTAPRTQFYLINGTLWIKNYTYSYYSTQTIQTLANQTEISALVEDVNHNNIPDGTLVSFNTTAGNLSYSSCLTKKGSCIVNLTIPNRIGAVKISAHSFNVSTNLIINVS